MNIIKRAALVVASLIGLSLVVSSAYAAGDGVAVPPVGTRCIGAYYALSNSQLTGTNVMVFEQGGLHRWRLQGNAGPVLATTPVELSKFSDIKTSAIETGNFNYAGKTWTMRSKGYGHVWYGNWNGSTLESAADVSGEYPQLGNTPILVKDVDCSGKRAFNGL